MSNDVTPALGAKQSLGAYTALAFWLLSVAGGLVPPIPLAIWVAVTPTVTVLRGDAGSFDSATVATGGFFSTAVTSIQTDEGSVAVQGVFTAPRGRALVVERTNKDDLRLCAAGSAADCAPLAGTWAGPLQTTPEARRVFDFQGHSLDYNHLGLWFMLGVLGFLIFGLAGGAMWDFGDDDENASESTASTEEQHR